MLRLLGYWATRLLGYRGLPGYWATGLLGYCGRWNLLSWWGSPLAQQAALLDLRLLGKHHLAVEVLFRLRTMISGVNAQHGPSLDGSIEAAALFGLIWRLSFEEPAPEASILPQLGGWHNCSADAVSEVNIRGAALLSSKGVVEGALECSAVLRLDLGVTPDLEFSASFGWWVRLVSMTFLTGESAIIWRKIFIHGIFARGRLWVFVAFMLWWHFLKISFLLMIKLKTLQNFNRFN